LISPFWARYATDLKIDRSAAAIAFSNDFYPISLACQLVAPDESSREKEVEQLSFLRCERSRMRKH